MHFLRAAPFFLLALRQVHHLLKEHLVVPGTWCAHPCLLARYAHRLGRQTAYKWRRRHSSQGISPGFHRVLWLPDTDTGAAILLRSTCDGQEDFGSRSPLGTPGRQAPAAIAGL